MDTVQEVHDIPAADTEPPRELGASGDTSFVLGLGKFKNDVKILLDIEKVLTAEELVQVRGVTDA